MSFLRIIFVSYYERKKKGMKTYGELIQSTIPTINLSVRNHFCIHMILHLLAVLGAGLWGDLVVEHLPIMHEVPESIPRKTKINQSANNDIKYIVTPQSFYIFYFILHSNPSSLSPSSAPLLPCSHPCPLLRVFKSSHG